MVSNSSKGVEEYLPLKPDVFLILMILADGENHGYGIMKEAGERSAGSVDLQAGALYRRLKWMLDEALIVELERRQVPGEVTDERRRYYGISDHGRAVAAAEAARMAELVDAARARDMIREGRG